MHPLIHSGAHLLLLNVISYPNIMAPLNSNRPSPFNRTPHSPWILNTTENLGLDFRLGGSAPDTLGLGALEMLGRDPALIISLGTRGDSRAISANDSNLLRGIDLLASTRGALSALAAFAATLLLGEEGSNPGIVDEVKGTGENSEENDIQKDARSGQNGLVATAESTYICGSKMLVGASTMLTVSLYAARV